MDENQKTLEEKLYEVLEQVESEEKEGATAPTTTEEEQVQENGGTHTPEEPNQEEDEEELEDYDFDTASEEPTEKTFTQSQVNDLVGNTRKEARDRVFKELLERYGVNDNSELDGVFGKGQAYDLLNDDYTNQGNELTAVKTENALLKSKIVEDRWEDAKAILRSKGMEVTVDNILSEALTHPEWLGNEEGNFKQVGKQELDELSDKMEYNRNKSDLNNMLNNKPATIKKVGVSSETEVEGIDEKKQAMKLFGL